MDSNFISVAQMQENPPHGAQRAVREELFAMQQAIKAHMDTGLSADDMRVAQAVRDGVDAAEDILDKIFT